MIRRWRDLSLKERSLFLLLFAVLLPTILLFAWQFTQLSVLRDQSKAAFQNELKQGFLAIEDKTEARLVETARHMLQDFPETDLKEWNSERIKENLTRILAKNEGVEGSFIGVRRTDEFELAANSRAKGYRETKTRNTPNEAFDLLDEEDFVIPIVMSLQTSINQGINSDFFVAQRRCEKCAGNGQSPTSILYLYRTLSNTNDLTRLRFIGVRLKNDYLVNEFLAPAITESARTSSERMPAAVVFGVFNEQKQLLFSSAAENRSLDKFEIKAPFGRVFPLWTVAGSLHETKIEDLSNLFFRTSLILMSLVFGLLALGVILLSRVTRREAGLAKAKSAFVSNVSHELKTPLALIRLFAETLQSGRVKQPEKAQEYFRIITSETRRLTMLIDNILDFSAIEAGRKNYNLVPRNLADTVSEVVQNYSYSLENAGFKVETRFEENLPLIPFDCDAISQAVLNLLNNAVKYSTDEKFIGVSVGRRDGNLVVEVTDHGIGIGPNEQEKIFEDFYRVGGSSDVHNVRGSGLGLSLVKHIVEAHGGRVSINSVLHRGSTFTILLPIEIPT